MNSQPVAALDALWVLEQIDEMRAFFWLAVESNPELLEKVDVNVRLAIQRQAA